MLNDVEDVTGYKNSDNFTKNFDFERCLRVMEACKDAQREEKDDRQN